MGATDNRAAGHGGEPHSASVTRTDERLVRLRDWVARVSGTAHPDVAPASADASFRRYFRVTLDGVTRIVMDAPPDKEDVGPFIRVAGMLATIGVNAPRILQGSLEEGFLLLTDLGRRTYLDALASGRDAEGLYRDAIAALVAMQAGGRPFAATLPPYDEALLLRELQLFPDWFLGRHLGVSLDAADAATLQRACSSLAAEALRQPRVFVHRDYHSRNLMAVDATGEGSPGILDFQDAVYGPVTYDLVSLLRDCYVEWPDERVAGWVDAYRGLAQAAGLDAGPDRTTFQRWFDWMGVQRHMKAIGIFARLWHRDGKPGYLGDIPRTLGYVTRVAGRYPELQGLNDLLLRHVTPVAARITQART